MRHKIYFDFDGVLADFEEGVYQLTGVQLAFTSGSNALRDSGHYKTIFTSEDFFLNLNVFDGAKEMIEYAQTLGDVEFLTAVGRESNLVNVGNQKIAWGAKHFPGIKVNCVARSEHKEAWAAPGVFLVDDRLERCVEPFTAAGGIGIHHTDCRSTMDKLRQIKG